MGKHERKNDKRKQIILSIVLSAVMIFSAFGVMIGSFTNNEMNYNGHTFEIKGSKYVTKINGNEMEFDFLPPTTESINLSNDTARKIKESYVLMITFDPSQESNLPVMELVRFDLSQKLGKIMISGVMSSSEQYQNFSIITCENATQQSLVIILNMSDNTSITDTGNCIYLNARGSEFLRLRDRVLYSYYGVIKNG